MGQNKDAAVGFIGIGIIIAIIVGVVVVLLPGESEIVQNSDVTKPNNIEFDPKTVELAEKVFPSYQDSFRLILEQCHVSNSYTDYLVFEESIPSIQSGIPFGIEDMKKGLTLSEKSGYNNHPTIGPMLKNTRVLEEAVNDCIIDLQDKYEKNMETVKKQEEKIKLDTEEKITEFMENYKGKDDAGPTLYNTMGLLMEVSYPGENILSSPSTNVWVDAYPDYSKEVSDKYWKFEINIDTYKEEIHLEWIIDTETKLVYPTNEESKLVLDVLDRDDK